MFFINYAANILLIIFIHKTHKMAVNLKVFENNANYEEYISGGSAILPNVSLIDETKKVFFKPQDIDWFYIYHTSNCKIERLRVENYPTIDLTQKVADGHFFGGYLSTYGGYGSKVNELINNGFGRFSNGVMQDNGVSYDGTSLLNGKTRFFVKKNFLTSSAQSVVPTKGTIYVIKEIPSDYYLKSYIALVTMPNSESVDKDAVYTIFNIDENYIKSAYQRIYKSQDDFTDFSGKIYSSFSTNIKINSETISGRRGYIVLTGDGSAFADFADNSVAVIEYGINTLDDVQVKKYMKIWFKDWTIGNIKRKEYDTMPDFSTEYVE